jgi:flagellar hook-associated protein 3 FlgL
MRITNKIMERNNLTNINNNKVLEDKLTTQLSTGKVINRPSDDPVVAIRALRLRSNVTEVTQYYSKNIPDANSWLDVTEDALKNLSTVITSMISQTTKGSNGDLTSGDRKIILEQLKALNSEVYATGDADYAGRYVFTGYRTDTSLSFQTKTDKQYTITEQLGIDSIDMVTTVAVGDLGEWTSANFTTAPYNAIEENQIQKTETYRIRLSYDNCNETTSFDYTDRDGTVHTGQTSPVIQYYDATGTLNTIEPTTLSVNNDPYAALGDGDVIYVPETGEILLGKDAYNDLMAVKDDATTATKDEGKFFVTYQKTEFEATDLRPEHYFYCTSEDVNKNAGGTFDVVAGSKIEYNIDYLNTTLEKQSIEYDVGFNTVIRVNSTADECFVLGINREVDDLITSLQNVVDLEDTKARIETKISETTDAAELETLNNQLTAVDKALTYSKDVCQRRFEKGITSLQGFLDDTNLAITNVGTRSSKLALINSRLQNQKTTFETLRSNNEDADVTEVAINLNSADVTYQAALMATSKVMQQTLLSYI